MDVISALAEERANMDRSMNVVEQMGPERMRKIAIVLQAVREANRNYKVLSDDCRSVVTMLKCWADWLEEVDRATT